MELKDLTYIIYMHEEDIVTPPRGAKQTTVCDIV